MKLNNILEKILEDYGTEPIATSATSSSAVKDPILSPMQEKNKIMVKNPIKEVEKKVADKENKFLADLSKNYNNILSLVNTNKKNEELETEINKLSDIISKIENEKIKKEYEDKLVELTNIVKKREEYLKNLNSGIENIIDKPGNLEKFKKASEEFFSSTKGK
jgi:protein subunit release factor A